MDDPLKKYPGYVLRRASAIAVSELNEKLRAIKLRNADIALLMLIDQKPGITQSDAGRVLDIARANMAPFVARLEKAKIVTRHAVDGRSQRLELTSRGNLLMQEGRRIVDAYEKELMRRVPADMRDQVLPILLAIWRSR